MQMTGISNGQSMLCDEDSVICVCEIQPNPCLGFGSVPCTTLSILHMALLKLQSNGNYAMLHSSQLYNQN
jgi:hypothetical protein